MKSFLRHDSDAGKHLRNLIFGDKLVLLSYIEQ